MDEARIELFDRLTLFGRRYYWRAVARNGESVAVGGEAYNTPAARDHGLNVARVILADADRLKVAK
jgi:uncharacterized protein YegP (UPF0339 family)